ncbi:MAG TPA: hypothetical protein PKV55_08935 [Nitrospira sp.]|nr:hypothetical protein [Nitrospira sp.]MBS0173039.1 hypothetical protein [Nitrospira sp.]MCW5779776.1 hypothetical protein [Nitrospira sp.]HNI68151.1 hypothetical protein [Nitrospira sp.]HNK13923.1 hypothetical protein [Nitrospira sp.]
MNDVMQNVRKRVVEAVLCSACLLWLGAGPVLAQPKGDKVFQAVATDAKGVETEVHGVIFYWEEKISETSFVPHELKEVPVKRGTATVKIKFDVIKTIDVKPSGNGTPPAVSITLSDGKAGEFTLAIAGSFKGQSDFGEVELPAVDLKRIAFK